MSIAAHGNWCGPGWSARQWKDAKDLTEEDKLVPAVDALDQACKNHDIGIAEGDPDANKRFYEEAASEGFYGLTLANFVKVGGPSLQNYLRGGEEINAKMSGKPTKKLFKFNNKRAKLNEERRQVETFERTGNPLEVIQEAIDDLNAGELTGQTFVDAINEVEVTPNANFVTPDVPTMRAEPSITRQDRPLRGERPDGVGSLTNLLNQVDNEEMDNEDVVMAPMAARSAAVEGQTTKAGNRETLVKYNARSEMGIFTETRTAYLPVTVYFSINRTDIVSATPLRFRVDWPYEIFSRTALTQQQLRILYSEATIRAAGISNDMARSGVRSSLQGTTGITGSAGNFNTLAATARDPALNQGQLYPFPTTVVGATAAVQGTASVQGRSSSGTIPDASVIPAYRKWYAKMYQYAHCMETEWKVTYFSGDSNEEFQNMRVYEGMDCQSTGNTDTIPTDVELGTIDHWPYLKKHDLIQRTESNANQRYVISGKWNPNMQFPTKMVANEEDIKTWTRLGTNDFVDRNPAAYRNDVVLLHYNHPNSVNQAAFMNCRIDLRYKIQFKDLSNNLRWPKANVTALTLSNLDCIQTPYPTQSTGAGAIPERIFCDGVIPN